MGPSHRFTKDLNHTYKDCRACF